MSQDTNGTNAAFEHLGLNVSRDLRSGNWGWSIENKRLTRPWVGDFPSREAATSAALDWLLDAAWRGVLYPILQSTSTEQYFAPLPDDERLLEPWLRAFEPQDLPVE